MLVNVDTKENEKMAEEDCMNIMKFKKWKSNVESKVWGNIWCR